MPGKIQFKVIFVSSQDENYKSSELNVHGPTTKGWQSVRCCTYPQDIVIQLDKRTRLRKIQILSHQYLIATKIEFYIGDVPDLMEVSVQNSRYTRLGYVALSDNEKTGYKARELKSVHVDAVGHFIKLAIHKNHLNKQNLFNQVSLIAINVIGDEIWRADSREGSVDERSDKLVVPNDRPDYISPLDDLAFDMYQDPEIALILRKLERKKQEAVLEERYDYAKTLKTTIQQLQKVGEKLGRYEVEKRQAVEHEDYDKAKLKKIQMDEYRQQVYEHLQIAEFVDISKAILPPLSAQPPRAEPVRQMTPPAPMVADFVAPTVYMPPPIPSTAYDERPLPAIRSKQQQDMKVRESIPTTPWTPPSHRAVNRTLTDRRPSVTSEAAERQAMNEMAEDDTSGFVGNAGLEPEPMNERDMREAAGIIEVFGIDLASKAYSKHWSFREEALAEVHHQMLELEVSAIKDEAKGLLRAALLVFNKAVRDNVLSVFSGAINLHRMILADYISKHRIPKPETAIFIEKSMPGLLLKTGDSSVRQRDLAKALIIEESSFPEAKKPQVLIHECIKPFKASTAPRLALSRMEVVESLYSTHGLSATGLTIENMMGLLTIALRHTSGEVRDIAERLITSLYRIDGATVRDFLPPDDEQTRKNLIYKQLFSQFSKIDETPVVAKEPKKEERQKPPPPAAPAAAKPVKAARPAAENKKQKPESRAVPLHQDHTCIFCGSVSETLTEEGLDTHYWKQCPMLKKCPHCKQVVEVASYTDHLLSECEAKVEFVQCPRCTEAIPAKAFQQHSADRACSQMETGKSRCPLCHANVPGDEETWKQHLMGREGCKQNPRRTGAPPVIKTTKSSPQQTKAPANVAKGRLK